MLDVAGVVLPRGEAVVVVKAARMGKDMADRCAEIRLRAERRAGEMLRETGPRHGGDRRSESRSSDPTLNDLGVTKDQSSRWQRIADVPEAAEIQRALDVRRGWSS